MYYKKTIFKTTAQNREELVDGYMFLVGHHPIGVHKKHNTFSAVKDEGGEWIISDIPTGCFIIDLDTFQDCEEWIEAYSGMLQDFFRSQSYLAFASKYHYKSDEFLEAML